MTNVVLMNYSAANCVKPVVIALHCSGSSGRQWQSLSETLEPQFEVMAPDLFGAASTESWPGDRAFRLADDAAAVVHAIDRSPAPVHLVGHSYGGAVAMRAAVARPNRVASLSLYEPTAFQILKAMGPDGREALQGIGDLARDIEQAILSGAYRRAAERFVDYWNGPGSWTAMSTRQQTQLVGYAPKAMVEFHALFAEAMPLVAYRRLRVPLFLMRGEHAPLPTEMIVRKMTSFMQPAAAMTIAGAGHMGPISHANVVARAIADHVRSTQRLGDAAYAVPGMRRAA